MDDVRPPYADQQTAFSPEARRWMDENREAIEAWDAWVEEHGLPMADLRQG